MSRLLEKAINRIRALPAAEQEAAAALILERFPDGQRRDTPSARPWIGPVVPLGKAPGDPPASEMSDDTEWEATPENAERICEHIKMLIETSRVSEARRIVSAIRHGVSAELDYWKKVLAEPVVRVGKASADGDHGKDMLWIENNADKYKGKWIALKNGVLLGSHESHAELHQTLKKSGRLTGTLFFRVGK
ncbi:hypothetical protein QUF72_02670 [Desulfobacterales bacterium HSG2]|nr:hypothetical protein [Desulfobacterales bacterium HSG2]